MARHARREFGSIYRHGDRWRVSVSLGSDAFGKRVRKEWQCRSAASAERKLREVTQRLRTGLPPEDDKVSVAVYADEWLRAVRPSVRPATYEQYRHLARHLTTEFGHLPLVNVTPRDVRLLIEKRVGQGYAPRTIRGVIDVLRMMSRQAMSDGILQRNVAELVQKPKLEQKEPQHFTAEQARRFLEVAKDDELFSLWATALGTGLRRGELLGLTWLDVDLEAATVSIRRAKTAAGVRVIPLPTFVAAALASRPRTLGPIWPVSPWHVSRRMTQLCERAGLPRLGMHGLRHSAASLMLDAGVDPLTIQSILGHTRVSMTQHYARAGDELRRDAVERLGRAVNE